MASLVGDVSRDRTKAVAKKLPQAGDDANHGSRGPPGSKVLPIDTRTPFIGHVTKKVHEPHDEGEGEGRR
jgi:hypothetical protein